MNCILFYAWECEQWARRNIQTIATNSSKNLTTVQNIKSKEELYAPQTPKSKLDIDSIIILLPTYDFRAKHLTEILKVDRGTVLQAGIVNASLGSLEVFGIDSNVIELVYTASYYHQPKDAFIESNIELHMLLAHVRPPVMKRVIKDLSTMAVASINVCISTLCEKSYINSSLWNETDTLLLQGGMQGGGYKLPKIKVSYSLRSATSSLDSDLEKLDVLNNCSIDRLVCDVSGSTNILEFFAHIKQEHIIDSRVRKRIVIAIGPERGFTEDELAFLVSKNFLVYNLGKRTLRSETAITFCTGLFSLLE